MTHRLHVSAPTDPIGVLGPIRWLAPFWPALALIALVLSAAAMLAGTLGFNVWQLVAGVAGATLGLLALVAALTASRRAVAGGSLSAKALTLAFEADPDPVLVSDQDADVLSVNKAAQDIENIHECLQSWCVDPAKIIAGILAELSQNESAERSFRRNSGTLSVFAFASGDFIVWRLRHEGGRRSERWMISLCQS